MELCWSRNLVLTYSLDSFYMIITDKIYLLNAIKDILIYLSNKQNIMVFRCKDGSLIIIEKAKFTNDKLYYEKIMSTK